MKREKFQSNESCETERKHKPKHTDINGIKDETSTSSVTTKPTLSVHFQIHHLKTRKKFVDNRERERE